MKKIIILLLCLFVITSLPAEDVILTAGAFFQSVSEFYGTITDYEAKMGITTGSSSMEASVSFKRPNLLRIDFSNPATQVILFNGSQLTIYLPGSSAVLTQTVSSEANASTGANLATPQGLTLMNRYYSITYLSEKKIMQLDDPKTVENPSDEMVVKLKLERKNSTEGFRQIILSINPDTKLIRRVEAVTTANENFVFNFTEYALNQRIPDTRFIYDSPSSANTYSNFLFSE
ncbi:MAG TPA: outer-membrane lipoprotein carrier protein LolA [Treponemataceae bacterium]|jgi:outer membrane lipoprotein-sorting protein|nr:outer-membrane lipoprotein carrier protein LolA [Treponemataceae bacterium]HQL03591.1 outer-membrane lipoprotein carrier protein LolA [Treponemataceae bacterium]